MSTSAEPIAREVPLSYDAVLEKLTESLAHEGFGIITEIDLKKTFEAKLGVQFRRYKILGACNPGFAHRAVSEHPEVGVMLPCNVVVYELENGHSQVVAVDPMAQLAGIQHDLADLAAEVRQRLAKAIGEL